MIMVNRVPANKNMELITIVDMSMYTGRISATIPNTSALFAIMLPMTFPKARFECFFSIDFICIVSSGIEPPMPMRTIPIKKGETSNNLESSIEEFTNQFPETNNTLSEAKKIIHSL